MLLMRNYFVKNSTSLSNRRESIAHVLQEGENQPGGLLCVCVCVCVYVRKQQG